MPRYHLESVRRPDDDDWQQAAETYEASDEFIVDALEWALDNPTDEVIEACRAAYTDSRKYQWAVDDIVAGEREVA